MIPVPVPGPDDASQKDLLQLTKDRYKAHDLLTCIGIRLCELVPFALHQQAEHIEISNVGIEPRVGDVHLGGLEYVQSFNVPRNFPSQQLAHQSARPNVGVRQEIE